MEAPLARSIRAPRVTGRPRAWARDMALVGGLTSLGVPSLVVGLVPPAFPLLAGLFGLLTGGLLGLWMPALLERLRGRVPIPLLLLLGVPMGALWGSAAGVLAGLPLSMDTAFFGALAGGIAGAIQFGWWWFPYTFQTVRGGRTWPLLVGAVLMLPVLAVAAFAGTMALVMGI